jgi:phosphoribosylglycinamide formyltransferase 1
MKIAVLASTNGTDLPALFEQSSDTVQFLLITNKPECGAIEKAKQYKIPYKFIDSKGFSREEYDHTLLNTLHQFGAEFVFLVGYMRIVSPVLINAYPHKILNIHPSLLPKFAGGMDSNVHAEVLKSGEKQTGATLHFVTEAVDEGPIFLQKSCSVLPDDTPETLKKRVQILEQEMLREALKDILKVHSL